MNPKLRNRLMECDISFILFSGRTPQTHVPKPRVANEMKVWDVFVCDH